MSDSSRRIKPSSVAAFLFMPQFRLSFQHFSFIVPVFIRTIAVMFEQAGLLPQNHPATRYGMEGVKRYKFSELMGEAFYTLRSTAATPYQWSLFVAVVMMVVFTILSAVTTLLNLSGMLIGTASAQIFDNPNGPTDLASVPADTAAMFSRTIPAGGGHGDYGIMVLDKMLRQGAEMRGGPIQNAFGSLMQIYNAGVLIIAGIMLFWIILSVVVDTAKTGTFGGGRHNMVWAPIRIVFALGLLIPLGTSGFSSGQFMVMKLAEWGSNFGTRAWVQYVTSVAAGSNLIAAYGQTNPTSVVSQYAQMWICRVAYNGASEDAMPGGVPTAQKVTLVPAAGDPDRGTQSYTFKNNTAGNTCGTVVYPTGNDAAMQASLASTDIVERAVANYKMSMIRAYSDLLVGGGSGGMLEPKAREFACSFVAQHIFPAGGAPDPLAIEGCGAPACGAGAPGSGIYPNTNCVLDMISMFNSHVVGTSSAAYATLQTVSQQPAFLTDVQARGWAGMGIWYHRIEQMNSAVGSFQTPPITITGGDPANGGGGSQHAAKVAEIISQYQRWWLNLPSQAAAATGALSSSAAAIGSSPSGGNIETGISKTAGKDLLESVNGSSPTGFANAVTGLMGNKQNAFVLNLLDPADASTYPLAQLSKIGHWLLGIALGMYALLTVLEVLTTGWAAGWLGTVVNAVTAFNIGAAAQAFIHSPIIGFITTMAGLMAFAGLILTYYIPLLPFIRATHAVLTWMISVFEAVVMVPIAALAHLTTEGEGIAGGAKQVWILWLNVLLRPVLTVIGFVAALIIFNTFVIYLHDAFATGMMAGFSSNGGAEGWIASLIYTFIYVFIVYTAANSTFKLLDLIPNALMRWIGGSADQSFDHDADNALGSVGSLVQGIGSGFGKRAGLTKEDRTEAVNSRNKAKLSAAPRDSSRSDPQGLGS